MSGNRASRLGLAPALVSMTMALAGCADLGLDTPVGAGSPSFFGGAAQEQRERLIRMGDDALRGGDVDTAVNIFHRAYELDEKNPEAARRLGDALLRAGRTQDAIDVFRAHLRRNPTDLEGTLGYGRAMLALGRPDAALAQIEEAQAKLPTDRRLANMTGVCLDLMGEHAKAQRAYRKGIAVAPDHLPLKNNLALSLLLGGDPAAAVALLEPLARGANRTIGLQQSLAAAYVFKGDIAAANRLLRLDFGDAEVRDTLAYYSQLRGLGRSPAIARALLGGVEPAAMRAERPERAVEPAEKPMAKADPAMRQSATVAAQPAPAPKIEAPRLEPRPLIIEPLHSVPPAPTVQDNGAVRLLAAAPSPPKAPPPPKVEPPKGMSPTELKASQATANASGPDSVVAILPVGDPLQRPVSPPMVKEAAMATRVMPLASTTPNTVPVARATATPSPVGTVPPASAPATAAPAPATQAKVVLVEPKPVTPPIAAAPPAIPATVEKATTTAPTAQTVAVRSTAPPPAAPAPLAGDYVVYLGIAQTAAEATTRWNNLKKAHPSLLDEIGRLAGSEGSRQTLLAGPFVDPIEAERTCAALLAAKVACTVKRL